MQDNLPELRDIHLPSGDISFFPLAYGWWVLAGVLAAAVLLAWLTRFLLQRSKKRYALKLLAAARRPDLGSAVRMSEILRRICVYKYKTAAALFGMEWIEFLNRHAKEKFPAKPPVCCLTRLISAPIPKRMTTKTWPNFTVSAKTGLEKTYDSLCLSADVPAAAAAVFGAAFSAAG